MTRHRRALLAALGGAVLVLFAGRWLASFLADRWWAAGVSPSALRFTTRLHLLRLAIDATAVALASGWFVAHLLTVTRAVRSVHVPRHVGDIEFREALKPRALAVGAVSLGLVLGLVVGLDASAYWRVVALAWHGVTFGVAEPALGRDLGLYVAQLPLWRMLHEYAFLVVVIALAVVVTLYGVVGAVKVERRRPAINDHARAHIGWLLAALALALAWGYYLEPLELVAGVHGPVALADMRRVAVTAPALMGTALMVAVLSALWAVRPRHALVAAGWTVLGVASLGGHYVAPIVLRAGTGPIAPDSALHALESAAFGLDKIRRQRTPPPLIPAPLLDQATVRRLLPSASDIISVDAATIALGGVERAVWLVLSAAPREPGAMVAVAADRAGAGGAPLFYRAGDTLAYPTPYPLVALGPAAARPRAPRYHLGSGPRGVDVNSSVRRAMLAWALQASELLGPVSVGARLDWALDPGERLSRIAPFASWASVRARMVEGRLAWVADGYVSSRTFPLVAPLVWSGGPANSVRAGFLGVVDATTGDAHVYVREGADPLSQAWAEMSGGLAAPPDSIPTALVANAGYPEELFYLQAGLIARGTTPPGRLAPAHGAGVASAFQPAWDTTGRLLLAAAYMVDGSDRISALLAADADPATLIFTSIDSGAVLGPRALERSWGRFATFAPVQDSVTAAGARIAASPVRFWRSDEGLAAFQVHTAARENARPAIVWVTVATARRLGAGRTFAEAWDNLRGLSGPPVAPGGGQLPEARHWMRIADEALKRGDWAGFGRAFDALRRVLQPEPE